MVYRIPLWAGAAFLSHVKIFRHQQSASSLVRGCRSLHIKALHHVRILLLCHNFPGVKFDKHRAIGLKVLDRDSETKVI